MNEKIIKIKDQEYKCVFQYGYNDHYYCTIYLNENGKYLGELTDIKSHDSDLISRIKQFIEKL